MILVDTQAVVRLAQAPDLLSPKARDAIRQARAAGGLAVSDKTLWEIAMLVSRKRVQLSTSLREFLEEIERLFTVLPITAAVAERAVMFSEAFPQDPSDRIIAATATVHGIALITSDIKMRRSGEVPCIW